MNYILNNNGFILKNNENIILEHSKENPFISLGIGKETITQNLGDFHIEDKLIEKIPLTNFHISNNKITLFSSEYMISFKVLVTSNTFTLCDFIISPKVNRIFLKVKSFAKDHIYGCGEQFSYLNLKGRNFPIWTSEPGVGRDKNSYISFQADQLGIGGGNYYTTNYPQATFISNSNYMFHVDTTNYCNFDFTEESYTEITLWSTPQNILINCSDSLKDLVIDTKDIFGTQYPLPTWILDGIVLGMQGGTDTILSKVKKAKDNNININAVWCQDWVGKKITSFGKRLFWKWEKDDAMYPNFNKLITSLNNQGIKFLAYINPYLLEGTDMFIYASKHNYFIKKESGEDYISDFGEFYCGTIDFTNNEAMEWYKNIIKKNMIDIGISGWMADFGEYIPIDAVFSNGKSGKEMHNIYPVLWQKCNYDAVVESNKLGEIVFFTRSGGTGTQKYSTLMWAGDQSVDFTIHDGIASTIVAGLSLGLLGNGLTHFDIGGYTSLFGNTRTEELMLRSLEYSTFTAVMRTHEGNRPLENFQYDESEKSLKAFSKFSNIRKALLPYIKHIIEENYNLGLGIMRPLFLHYNDEICLDIAYEYLLGRDMLVAPVYEKGLTKRKLYLPNDNWIRLFSNEEYDGGWITVDAEVGNIPVFYRKDSKFSNLFMSIKN